MLGMHHSNSAPTSKPGRPLYVHCRWRVGGPIQGLRADCGRHFRPKATRAVAPLSSIPSVPSREAVSSTLSGGTFPVR
ncbi:hypothetical protein Y694_04562 [Methylibium sp. T29-B]|nr:hypothetical protein Y694_04562 [Methylibium sp. T29-B]